MIARRLLVAGAILAAVLAVAVAPAAAHALPQTSDPAAGAALKQAPTAVRITFGERPDPKLSVIRVLDSSGQDHSKGKTNPVPGDPKTLQVAVGPLSNGVYTVSWRTVSSVDGHLASGTFAFGVGVTPTAALTSGFATRSPTPSSASVLGRWLLYAGLMLLVGTAFVGIMCFEALPRRLGGLALVGCALGVVGAIGIAVDARGKAGLAWSSLLGSSVGHQLLWRVVPLMVVAVVLAIRRVTRTGSLLALGGAGGLVAMWGDVEASHSAASHSLRLLRMASQWAHFAAAGVWAGGLVALLISIGTAPADARAAAAKRYSFAALWSVAVIAGTGFQRGYDELRSLHQLFSTGFGQTVLVKIGLLGLLVILGAINRYRSLRTVERAPRRLQTIGSAEVALLAGVLLATGVLQGLAPPTSLPSTPVVHPIVLTGADFGTTVRVKFTISPGLAGFNQFTVSAADYDTSAPVQGTVSLGFSLPSRPDLGSSTLTLSGTKAGFFSGQGANLSLDGTWTVVVTIQRAMGGVQIPFTVIPHRPPQRIVVQPQGSGLPTLYTLELAGNQSVQTYLDPGHSGFNEFHVTFVGANSQEIGMAGLTVTETPPKGTTSPLAVRRLDPIGHFVADLPNTVKGTYRFDINGTTSSGTTIAGTFTIPAA